jgi:hypothetical protein
MRPSAEQIAADNANTHATFAADLTNALPLDSTNAERVTNHCRWGKSMQDDATVLRQLARSKGFVLTASSQELRPNT